MRDLTPSHAFSHLLRWIQLNFGDAGLLTLFRRVHLALRAGGRFVLEPQPWSSYRKNARVSELALANYAAIAIKPDAFEALLAYIVLQHYVVHIYMI